MAVEVPLSKSAPVQVLFLTTVLPRSERSGGEVVSQGVIDVLRDAGHTVRVLGYLRPGQDRQDDEVAVGRRPIESSSAGARKLAWMARALATRAPYTSAKYRSGAYRRGAARALSEHPDVVVLDHAQMYFAVPGESPPVVLLAHNAEANLYRRLSDASQGLTSRLVNTREARHIGGVETRLARMARQIWTVTDDDAEHFRTLWPPADVRTLTVASRLSAPPPIAPRYDVALLGSWSWGANARGLEWFCERVVPLVAELEVEVGGVGSEGLHGRYPNVSARGFVADPARYLSAARVIAVPAVTGGGIQVKTLDAIATGLPVVATPASVRGLEVLPASVAVADDPAQFAAHLRRFVRDRGRGTMRTEAIGWSERRRRRLETTIAGAVADLRRDEHDSRATPAVTWFA